MKKLTHLRFSCIGFFLLFNTTVVVAQEQFICVWRNPERTMTRIFPNAQDYRTVSKSISTQQRENIEKRLGSQLLPGQREQFQYYEMLDKNGVVIGYTIASSQRGQFGAIEFVFGKNLDNTIKGIYIQRARERDDGFRSREFLDSFLGKGADKAVKLKEQEKYSQAMNAIVLGVKKEFITFQELVLGK